MMKTPPASLAQWYMPENKRQVWLHNMFKLRREVQAIEYYAENKDAERLKKWTALLSEHYLEIGKMVPEWEKKLNTSAITALQESANAGRYQQVSVAINNLKENCEVCHTDFRSVTAAMYRAPDFSSMMIGASITYKDHMVELTEQINQIKIATEDEIKDTALSSLSGLKKGMNLLGETCVTCHKKDTRHYPDDTINKTITALEQSLKTGTQKEQGRELGTLAVLACARCHGTHRLSYDIRKTLVDGPNWSELLRH